MEPSKRFSLNTPETKKWIRNTALFFAPAFLIFLMQIQAGRTVEDALIALQVWLLNTAIDLTRKFIAQG